MSSKKKYFWLKQPINFFDNPKLKKLRKIAGGDVYTIIYQKIMLLSVPHDGLIVTLGLEDDLAGELSLVMDEDEINVQVTLDFMDKFNLIEELDENTFLITDVPTLIGKEGDSAERVRRHRKNKALQQDNQAMLQCNETVTKSNTEKEIELNKEIELEKKGFIPPSIQEAEKYIMEHNYQVDAVSFVGYYENTDWYTAKGKPVKNWKLTLRNWHLRSIKGTVNNQKNTSASVVGLA